ncbi:MAG: hypothetical protein AB8G05_09250 [Oligoflexales bacterium]
MRILKALIILAVLTTWTSQPTKILADTGSLQNQETDNGIKQNEDSCEDHGGGGSN